MSRVNNNYTLPTIEFYANFYTNDATTRLVMDDLKKYADSLIFSDDQSYVIATFKNTTRMARCSMSILGFVSNLSTGNIEMYNTGL
jgi:hypothetical protein